MVFYVGNQITATVEGSALKFERCSTCRTEYVYAVRRQAQGSGHSPFFMDNAGAEARASLGAQSALDSSLNNAIDPVKCPNCRNLQPHMIRHERVHRTKWTAGVGMGVSFLLAIAAGAIWAPEHGPMVILGTGLLMLCMTAALCAYWWTGWSPAEGRMALWPCDPRIMDGGMTLAAFEAMLAQGRAAPSAPQGAAQIAPPPAQVPYGASPLAQPPLTPDAPAFEPPTPQSRNTAQKAPWEI